MSGTELYLIYKERKEKRFTVKGMGYIWAVKVYARLNGHIQAFYLTSMLIADVIGSYMKTGLCLILLLNSSIHTIGMNNVLTLLLKMSSKTHFCHLLHCYINDLERLSFHFTLFTSVALIFYSQLLLTKNIVVKC